MRKGVSEVDALAHDVLGTQTVWSAFNLSQQQGEVIDKPIVSNKHCSRRNIVGYIIMLLVHTLSLFPNLNSELCCS